ncbi:dihydropteroate synthase [Thermococcus zilligii]|uniref:dihydropteroate synthase n=1 Tax=Thermococcus zilligii TaxID=54076 RepID=UPI00029A817B|nr:dihydropteroate synthase [Thermococcus zilligii]
MKFAGVDLGEPRIMGVINVSPESFYEGSVRNDEKKLVETAVKMVEEGASFIDIGAKSTAPYLETRIPVEEEVRRAVWAVRAVRDSLDVPISIDTTSARVAEEALKAGADVINDVTGLKGDPSMADVAAEYGAPVVLCAHGRVRDFSDPLHTVIDFLQESLVIAREHGIEDIAVDPAIGFLRPEVPRWYEWDSKVLANLNALKILGRPVLVGLSRKSFIGAITGRKDPAERLLDAVKMAAFIKRFRP